MYLSEFQILIDWSFWYDIYMAFLLHYNIRQCFKIDFQCDNIVRLFLPLHSKILTIVRSIKFWLLFFLNCYSLGRLNMHIAWNSMSTILKMSHMTWCVMPVTYTHTLTFRFPLFSWQTFTRLIRSIWKKFTFPSNMICLWVD